MVEFLTKELDFKNKQVYKCMESLGFILFCLFAFDCSISGSGKWLMIGRLSIRMILLMFSLFLTFPSVLKSYKQIITNKFTLLLFLFAIILFVGVVRGILVRNRMDVFWGDIKGFIYLGMYPMVLLLLQNKKRIEFLMQCMIIGSTLLALIILFFQIVYIFTHAYAGINMDNLLNIRFIAINPMTPTLIRLFPFSNIFFICNCAFSFYFFFKGRKYSIIYIVTSVFSLIALLLTYTRSTYLGFVVCILLLVSFFFLIRNAHRTIIRYGILTVLLFGISISALGFMGSTNYLKYGVERCLISFNSSSANGSSVGENELLETTVVGDSLRHETVNELKTMIKQSPIIGNGVGAAVKCRKDGLTEYFYLDLINKMGLIGLCAYIFPALIMGIGLISQWRTRKKQDISLLHLKTTMFSCLIGFMVVSIFNPYMNAVLGIMMYCVTMGTYCCESINSDEGMDNLT